MQCIDATRTYLRQENTRRQANKRNTGRNTVYFNTLLIQRSVYLKKLR